MNAVKAVCLLYILFTVLRFFGWSRCFSSAKALQKFAKKEPALESPTGTLNDEYSKFKEYMRKTKQMSETLLAKKELQDAFNKQIVEKGIKIDYTDTAKTSSVLGILMDGMCASCSVLPNECACLQGYECNIQCR